jgi:hypothetical protein
MIESITKRPLDDETRRLFRQCRRDLRIFETTWTHRPKPGA